jgi:hypothetical protein
MSSADKIAEAIQGIGNVMESDEFNAVAGALHDVFYSSNATVGKAGNVVDALFNIAGELNGIGSALYDVADAIRETREQPKRDTRTGYPRTPR